ncbi:MAG: rhodanese-like domain-containing protein [Phycisphaerales bacterium]
MIDTVYKMAVVACLAGAVAGGHALFFKPDLPLLLKEDGPPVLVPAPKPTPGEPTAVPAPAPKDLVNISIAEAFAYFEQQKPFIDARHMDEFKAGHVRGAYQLSADELLAGKGMTWLGALDKSDFVVIYCGGGDCDASHNLYNYLTKSFGFTSCKIMHDGWPAWQSAGHPGDTGEPQIGNE